MIDTSHKYLVFKTLKSLLKARKWKYSHLAKKLHLSESSVKRLFANADCTLERLLEICKALDISVFDLMEASRTNDDETFTLSQEAETFFSQNLDYFLFFRKLRVHGNIEAVQKEDNLTRATVKTYINKLAVMGLIEYYGHNEFRFTHPGMLRLNPKGELFHQLIQRWMPSFLKDVQIHSEQENYRSWIFTGRLTPEHFQELQQELEALKEKYSRLGFLDQRLHPQKSQDFTTFIGLTPKRAGADIKIRNIDQNQENRLPLRLPEYPV